MSSDDDRYDADREARELDFLLSRKEAHDEARAEQAMERRERR